MRLYGLCLILIAIGLATACGGKPAATTATLPTDQTVTCTVFATREGLVGRTTANGHVIQPADRFVALPSRSVLASAGGNEFQVRVTYKTTTVTVPVWDVGPWNTEDNYWDPSEQRLRWKDLPQCRPEAQAAYEAKYNDGKDQSGRQVKNPAGIDLSDGTWAALGMTDNDKVVVEYLWTKGSTSTGTGVSAPTQRPATPAPSADRAVAPVAPAAPAMPTANIKREVRVFGSPQELYLETSKWDAYDAFEGPRIRISGYAKKYDMKYDYVDYLTETPEHTRISAYDYTRIHPMVKCDWIRLPGLKQGDKVTVEGELWSRPKDNRIELSNCILVSPAPPTLQGKVLVFESSAALWDYFFRYNILSDGEQAKKFEGQRIQVTGRAAEAGSIGTIIDQQLGPSGEKWTVICNGITRIPGIKRGDKVTVEGEFGLLPDRWASIWLFNCVLVK